MTRPNPMAVLKQVHCVEGESACRASYLKCRDTLRNLLCETLNRPRAMPNFWAQVVGR